MRRPAGSAVARGEGPPSLSSSALTASTTHAATTPPVDSPHLYPRFITILKVISPAQPPFSLHSSTPGWPLPACLHSIALLPTPPHRHVGSRQRPLLHRLRRRAPALLSSPPSFSPLFPHQPPPSPAPHTTPPPPAAAPPMPRPWLPRLPVPDGLKGRCIAHTILHLPVQHIAHAPRSLVSYQRQLSPQRPPSASPPLPPPPPRPPSHPSPPAPTAAPPAASNGGVLGDSIAPPLLSPPSIRLPSPSPPSKPMASSPSPPRRSGASLTPPSTPPPRPPRCAAPPPASPSSSTQPRASVFGSLPATPFTLRPSPLPLLPPAPPSPPPSRRRSSPPPPSLLHCSQRRRPSRCRKRWQRRRRSV